MKKIKLTLAKKKDTISTGRKGTIHASYEELVEKLGKPHDCTRSGDWESRDNKVRVEWAFIINNNKKLVFTVYDYKSRYPLEQIKQWNLGGKSVKIKNYLRETLLVE